MVKAVLKVRCILGILNNIFARLTVGVFILAYSAFVRSQLESYVQAWSLSLRDEVKKMEALLRAAARFVPGLRHLSYEERLFSYFNF